MLRLGVDRLVFGAMLRVHSAKRIIGSGYERFPAHVIHEVKLYI